MTERAASTARAAAGRPRSIVNALIGDLVRPTTEVARVITPSQKATSRRRWR